MDTEVVQLSDPFQQLLDLDTFLQSHYREAPPRYSDPGFPIF